MEPMNDGSTTRLRSIPHEVLPAPLLGGAEEVRRIIFCTGKVYYDLAAERRKQNRADTAIIRVEQLYPLNEDAVKEAVAPFAQVGTLVWCQEEPENMGKALYDQKIDLPALVKELKF